MPMEKMGIKGLSYPKYDLTICTYCSGLTGVILSAIALAWKGEPWDDVEVLTGKAMRPTPGKKKTILLGKCMYQANKDNSDIQKMLAVKGCRPSLKAVVKALHQAGIEVDPAIFEQIHAFYDPFFSTFGHVWLLIVLIHRGDVEIDRFHFLIHAAQALTYDNRQLESVSWIVAHAVWNS